jgi:RimJ/RimL family protein N-acetyltransferase
MRDGGFGEEFAFRLATPRLALRPRRQADETVIEALAANPAIAPNLCATFPAETANALVIVERRNGRVVGAAAHGITGLGSGMEISLWVGEPYWGRGYGTEAAQALIDHAFADIAVEAVWCANRVTNARARRVIEKCGFQFRGNGMVRQPGRGAFPVERFALDRRNWASLKAWGAGREAGGSDDATRETAA